MDTLIAANCLAAGSLPHPDPANRDRAGAEDAYYRLHDRRSSGRAFGLVSLAATLLVLALTLELPQH